MQRSQLPRCEAAATAGVIGVMHVHERSWVCSKGRIDLVRSAAVSLECDARAPAGAMAQPVSALARRNLLWQEGRDAESNGRAGVHVDRALGAAALSALDRADAAGSAEYREQGVGKRE